MHKGTTTYTEYDYGDENLIGFLMDNMERRMDRIGHIHSHNTMNVFFSGTDEEELIGNSFNHDYYLSFIVNNYMDVTAKIAFTGLTEPQEVQVNYNCKAENGKNYKIPAEKFVVQKEAVFVTDCEIIVPEEEILVVPKGFSDRVDFIIQEAKNRALVLAEKNKANANNKNFGGTGNNKSFNGWENLNQSFAKEKQFNVPSLDEGTRNFIFFLLNFGNEPDYPISKEDDLIDTALENYYMVVTDVEEYTNSIINMYTALYDKFFDPKGDYSDYLPTLSHICDILENYVEDFADLVNPLINTFKIFKTTFEKELQIESIN